MALTDQIRDGFTRAGQEVKAVRAEKADDSAVVHNTGAETINGTKTFGSSPIVPAPSAAAHPVRNDDARNTNARPPTAHTHSASDITPRAVVTGSTSGAFGIVAGDGTDWYLTATANRTLTVSGGYDGQMLVVDILASGGARTITISGITLTTGMVASWSIPSGKVGTLGLRRTSGTWRVMAQTVDQ